MFKVLNKTLRIKIKKSLLTVCVGGEEGGLVVVDIQYLVSPALGLAVTMIKFLQRHFGVDKAYVGLELVFDSFDVLVRERQNRKPTHLVN